MKDTDSISETAKGVVIVGDGMVGKTALLFSFASNSFNEDYTPTVFDATTKDIYVPSRGRSITVGLWDTGGQEEFEQIRLLMYPNAQLVIICYSIDNKISLDNVQHIWRPEICENCPGVPFILVGCKSDYRCPHNSDMKLVSTTEAQNVAHQIGASMHIECSSKTRSNVDTIFEMAAELIIRKEEISSFESKRLRKSFLFGKRVPSQRSEASDHSSKPASRMVSNIETSRGQRNSFWCVPIRSLVKS